MLCMLIVSVTVKDNEVKNPSLIKQATFERGSSKDIRNVNLVATELGSTISFTGPFMGINTA